MFVTFVRSLFECEPVSEDAALGAVHHAGAFQLGILVGIVDEVVVLAGFSTVVSLLEMHLVQRVKHTYLEVFGRFENGFTNVGHELVEEVLDAMVLELSSVEEVFDASDNFSRHHLGSIAFEFRSNSTVDIDRHFNHGLFEVMKRLELKCRACRVCYRHQIVFATVIDDGDGFA